VDRVFEELQQAQVVRIKIEAVSLDSAIVKVHPDGTGAIKRTARNPSAKSRGGWTTKIHMVAAGSNGRNVLVVTGSGTRRPRRSCIVEPARTARSTTACSWIAPTRAMRHDSWRSIWAIPVVPSLKTRLEPWEYDHEMHKRRNEVERLFRRLKGFRRIFSRFEKLDVMFVGFTSFALIADGLRLC
jgi:transposase